MEMITIKSDRASLFTIIASLKYKSILCLLKEDGRNRSVSVYNDVIKILQYLILQNTSVPVYTVEVVISNQTELRTG